MCNGRNHHWLVPFDPGIGLEGLSSVVIQEIKLAENHNRLLFRHCGVVLLEFALQHSQISTEVLTGAIKQED